MINTINIHHVVEAGKKIDTLDGGKDNLEGRVKDV